MKTATVNIYKFEELSDDAKEKARQWWRTDLDYPWHDESLASIKTFCEFFGVKLTDWSIGAFTYYNYKTDATNENFRGLKLKNFNRDNMPTGYCLDCDLWMTFYDEFKRTGDAKYAFIAALDAAFKAWRKDIEYQYSDEATDESIIMNEYEFFENGKRAVF
jgi:hypothetical protein